jgi:hypothetical protein
MLCGRYVASIVGAEEEVYGKILNVVLGGSLDIPLSSDCKSNDKISVQ